MGSGKKHTAAEKQAAKICEQDPRAWSPAEGYWLVGDWEQARKHVNTRKENFSIKSQWIIKGLWALTQRGSFEKAEETC